MKTQLTFILTIMIQALILAPSSQAASFKTIKEFSNADLQALSEDFMTYCEPLMAEADMVHDCRIDRAKITSAKAEESILNSMKQYQYKLFMDPGSVYEMDVDGKAITSAAGINPALKKIIERVSYSNNPERQRINFLGLRHLIEPMMKKMDLFQLNAEADGGYARSLVMYDPYTHEFLTMSITYAE